MRRSHASAFAATLAAATLIALGACDRAPERDPGPVTFAVTADSLIAMTRDTLPTGDVSIECPLTLQAEVTGPATEYAILRGGRIVYYWWQTGNEAASYEWEPESLHRFWADTIMPVGDTRLSQEHGFGQSAPGAPVRGSVTFRYVTSNDEVERESEPFRFYCY